MKKTFVDLSYFSFSIKEGKDVLKICQSTVGFVEEMSTTFNCYFVARANNFSEVFTFKNLKIFLKKGNELQKWQIPFCFNWFIRSFKPNFILVHGFGYPHFLLFLKLMCPNAKIVMQCNGFAPKPTGFKKVVYQLTDAFINGYLFTGIENAKDWYNSKVFKKEKVFEVMEGSTNFRFDSTIKRSNTSYLWVGNLNENKDPITILKAFKFFLEQEPTAKLMMVFQGAYLLEEVKVLLSENNQLYDAVFLKGFVSNNELEEIYNKHQFFILGSHYEGSGYALLEAMACGCIPIVTRIPSYEFMTNNGDCALLFSPGDENEALNQLIQSQQIDSSMYQRKVLKQFENKLSFKAIAATITAVFQSL